MNRVLGAARMHLAHPLLSVGIPWMIVASSFAINVAIWAVGDVAETASGNGSTGGLGSLYIAVALVFAQGVTQIFPFAMGLSLSRRAFYLGTALTAVVLSVGNGVLLLALAALESATSGWGVGLRFWAPGTLDDLNPALLLLVYAAPMLACAVLGMALGVVFKRWGAPGLYVLGIGIGLLAGLAAVWATWQRAWEDVGGWFADQSVAMLAITLPMLLTIGLAGLAFLGLKRTVP
jgi:hypothetical protein